MGDDGQMLLLSALAACLCLFVVAPCVEVADSPYEESGHLSENAENVRWAQDSALRKAAFYSSAYPWDGREDAALHFRSDAVVSMDSLAGELLKHGVVYRFSFNDSLAGDYVATHPGNGTVNIGGALVEPAGGSVKICGCAYDVWACDGVNKYNASRVELFS